MEIGTFWSAATSSARRLGATYWASSAYMRPRSSGGFAASIARRAMPSMGSQPSSCNRTTTSAVRLLGVPCTRPPVFRPSAMLAVVHRVAVRPMLNNERMAGGPLSLNEQLLNYLADERPNDRGELSVLAEVLARVEQERKTFSSVPRETLALLTAVQSVLIHTLQQGIELQEQGIRGLREAAAAGEARAETALSMEGGAAASIRQQQEALRAALDGLMAESRRASAAHAARARHADSPITQAKLEVLACFRRWQAKPDSYPTVAAFTRDMMDKYPALERSEAVIPRWVRQWRGSAGPKQDR